MSESEWGSAPIAIVGMAGRFPDAPNLEAFWRNLAGGVESLISFSEEEMLIAGVDPENLKHPDYVRKGTVLEGAELFDAGFFGFNPREAEVLDPQQRVFLECAWEALEDAGYGGDNGNRSTGVFAGESLNSYVFSNLLPNSEVLASVSAYQMMLSTDKDFLATRVAYKLNLKGPAISIQTACSTSLVAVQIACQSLLARQCDMAIAGGVSISFPSKSGYLHTEGMILSPDGHCRPFDAQARGTRPGAGAGAIVLKRLGDALRDRDSIRAVIRGAAINNDGSSKMGYTAPSVDGQAQVVQMAHTMAGVDPESIGYVEAHGTATVLGDPIEFAALDRVFRAQTGKRGFCALGSVKGNIGHLDAAAGIAGVIKAVLALEHEAIPPTLHYRNPNPQIALSNSPFFVNDTLRSWKAGDGPRRAGVSSFGIGGTNAHLVVEEAPARNPSREFRPNQLIVVSGKTAAALDASTEALGRHLTAHPDISLADAAYTLQTGRRRFSYRRYLVCGGREEAVQALSTLGGVQVVAQQSVSRPVSFLFSGQGSQYLGMAEDLYHSEPSFRRSLDECAQLLEPHLGCDLRDILYPEGERSEEGAAASRLNETWVTQPALFAVEYSLARMWMSWGIVPDACLGHSIGEYVAACLAGVFSLADGLALVSTRGRLMQALPRGSMLAVPLPAEDVSGLLNGSLSLAAVNTNCLCTVSGTDAAINTIEKTLQAKGVVCRRVPTSHAFHSAMIDPAIESFAECVRLVRLSPPLLPFLSNVTGKWITPDEACSPAYWALHMRHTVRFADGLRLLLNDSDRMLLEVGPGQVLSTFARELAGPGGGDIVSSLPHRHDKQSAARFALQALGRLWVGGVAVDWEGFHRDEALRRVPLPTYPFERQRYCIEPKSGPPRAGALKRKADVADWFYVPSWKRSVTPVQVKPKSESATSGPWLLFLDETGLGSRVEKVLDSEGEHFVTVRAGHNYKECEDGSYTIAPGDRRHYDLLLRALRRTNRLPHSVMHLWNVTGSAAVSPSRDLAFYSLLYLAQAFGELQMGNPLELVVVADGLLSVYTASEPIQPAKALLLGPCRVIPQEYPGIECRAVDVGFPVDAGAHLAKNLLLELNLPAATGVVAYRQGYRWEQIFEPVRLTSSFVQRRLRNGGVYLITGGLGGIGLTFARHLAETLGARLVLTARSPLPPREEWDTWLANSNTDSTTERIRQVRALEQAGAEVMVLAADVSDPAGMHQALALARQRFGRFDGVIHAAGIAGGGMVQLKTREMAERVFAPKVDGTLILYDLLREDRPDFFMLCSSINALCGSIGGVDYTAANAFLDAFSLAHSGIDGCAMVSVNWDTWQQVGMAMNTEVPLDMRASWRRNLESGIKPAEALEAFRSVLGADLSQVAVVTRDLRSILDRQWNAGLKNTGANDSAFPLTKSAPPPARTKVQDANLEPATEIQRKIVEIWTELLGIPDISIEDNFFALGGHSLLATGVLSRIRSLFGVNLPLRTAFEAPTVRGLADQVEIVLWATSGTQNMPVETIEREEIEL